MNRDTVDTLFAFGMGDLMATVMLYITQPQLFEYLEQATLKLVVVLLSGFVGGVAGVVGKHVAERWLPRKHKVLLVPLALAALHPSCSAKKPTGTHATYTTADSTVVHITERIVPVYVPGDTVVLTQRIECPDGSMPRPAAGQAKAGRAVAQVSLRDGLLTARLSCEAYIDSLRVRDTQIERLRTALREHTATVEVPKPYVPWHYRLVYLLSVGVLVWWLVAQVAKVMRLY